MDLKLSGGERVHITYTSLAWFLALTALGTVIGEWAYEKWINPTFSGCLANPGETTAGTTSSTTTPAA